MGEISTPANSQQMQAAPKMTAERDDSGQF